MKRNVNNTDKIIRLIIGAVFIALFAFGVVGGTLGYVLVSLGAISLFTGLVNWCALYAVLGINTCKVK